MGGIVDNFTLMQLGRFVFGIGGESLAVAQNTYAVSWFKGKELNMVFGFQLSIARVGASVNFQVLSPLYNYISDTFNAPAYSALGWTLMISGSTCVMSFICSIILGWMDKRADRILKKSEQEDGEVVSFSLIIKHSYTVLQKYRHTRNFLETRVIIKILKNPCYSINVD